MNKINQKNHKKGIIILLACISSLFINAQTNVDSLINVINEAERLSDDEILENYLKICTYYNRNDNKKAIVFAFSALFYRHRLNIQKRKNAEQQRELTEQKNLLAEQQIIQLEKEKQLIAT